MTMMKKRIGSIFLSALLLVGCGAKEQAVVAAAETTQTAQTVETVSLLNTSDLFSNRDLEGAADLSKAETITLLGSTAQTDSENVTVDGSTVIISAEGVYRLTGSLEGQIAVQADKTDKVQLVLDNAEITSPTSAAIYVKQADKVFLTLAEGTQNRLENGGSFEAVDENAIDGAVFSKEDLTVNGQGALTVVSPDGHGIVSKDELVIASGKLTVQAGQHGLTGKDCICMAGGDLTVQAGEDGLHAKNSDESDKGFLYVGGGSVTVEAEQDAISATGVIQIENGSFRLTAGGGSEAVTMRPSDGAARFGAQTTYYGAEGSAKGIKSDSTITITGGVFDLDCADDGIHGAGDISISGGAFQIRTADDGIHSDANVIISGGSFEIPYCYEGIEGQTVTVNDGNININSADDGINAAGGMDSSGFGGAFPNEQFRENMRQNMHNGEAPTMPEGWTPGQKTDGQKMPNGERMEKGQFGGRGGFGGMNQGDSSAVITVNGGTITVVSDGDSLDSNGAIVLNGGTLNLTCSGNGNTCIDCDGNYTNSGAKVSTNDGSENGTMFGRR